VTDQRVLDRLLDEVHQLREVVRVSGLGLGSGNMQRTKFDNRMDRLDKEHPSEPSYRD